MEIGTLKKLWEEQLIRIKNNEISDSIVLEIYIPFCGQKCGFCNCFVRPWDASVIDNYIDILEEQILQFKETFKEYTFSSVIISGGSPLALGEKNINRLFDLLYSNFNFAEEKYIIVEIDLLFSNNNILKLLKQKGVTALTIGIQTTNNNILLNYNRHQTLEKIKEIVFFAKSLEFYVNLDLIYGLFGESLPSFKDSLEFVYSLESDQINVYKYEFLEEQEKEIKNGELTLPVGYYDILDECKTYLNSFFKNKPGIMVKTIKAFGDDNYRLTSYFREEENIDYSDWRETGSLFNLGYGDHSLVLGKATYRFEISELKSKYQNIRFEDVLQNTTIEYFDFKYFVVKYFLLRFCTSLDISEFKNIFCVDIFEILHNEIKFLDKLKKVKIDTENSIIEFNFKDEDEIILYQKIVYELYLKNKENIGLSTIN